LVITLKLIRDYRIHSNAEKAIITGGSAFNIKAESLYLGYFLKNDMIQLQETGQIFTEKAYTKVWE